MRATLRVLTLPSTLIAGLAAGEMLAACGSVRAPGLSPDNAPAQVAVQIPHALPDLSCAPALKSTYKLYVADVGKTLIIRFSPPNPNPQTVNVLGAAGVDVKFDRLKNMWVDEASRNSIHGFAPPYNGGPFAATIAPLSTPYGIAFDGANNMYIADTGNNRIGVLAPPYTSSSFSQTIAVTSPSYVAFDAKCDLFVASGAAHVLEFAPPYTSPPVHTLNVTGAEAVALDSHKNLFVGTFNQTQDEVLEFAPPYTHSPIATITNGVKGVQGLVLDIGANLFVSNNLANTITEYAPPYTGAPVLTLTKNLSHPEGITFGPK